MVKLGNAVIGLLFLVVCILIWQLGTHTEIRSSYQPVEGQLVLKMAEHRTEAYPTNEGTHLFAELVEERTEGQVKVLIYDGYEFGDEAGIVEQLSFGGIDFARISGVYLDAYMSELEIFCMPGLYPDDEAMMQVFSDPALGTRISETLKNEKINLLTWYPGSTRGIFYNERLLAYLKGGKVATPTSQMKIAEMEAMAFTPIPTLQGNVNSYLAGGYVVGAEGELLDYYYGKSYTKSGHFTMTASRVPEAIIASNTAFKEMTVEQQQIVTEAAIEAGFMTAAIIEEEEEKIITELEQAGYTIDRLAVANDYMDDLIRLETELDQEVLLGEIRAVFEVE